MSNINKVDINEKMYGMSTEKIMELYELQSLSKYSEFKEYPLYHNGIAFGITNNYEIIRKNNKKPIIIGGPCVCYSQASIEKVTIQDLMDIICPISYAAYVKCHVYIYFQIHEAILQQIEIDHFTSKESEWNNLLDKLRVIVWRVADMFNLSHEYVHVISTADDNVKNVIDNILDLNIIKKLLIPSFLYGMYSINNSSVHPKGDRAEALFLDIYRRNLATYLPITLSLISGNTPMPVIVVENCTQLKTSYKANLVWNSISANNNVPICHLVYSSTPGINGTEMYKCFSQNQICMNTSEEKIRRRWAKLDDWVKEYYCDMWINLAENKDGDEIKAFLKKFNHIREGLT